LGNAINVSPRLLSGSVNPRKKPELTEPTKTKTIGPMLGQVARITEEGSCHRANYIMPLSE